MKKLLILSITLNLFFAGILIGKNINDSNLKKSNNVLMYQTQSGFFDIYKTKHANIVMLGGSIIANINWNELLNRNDIINRGIGGDTTDGILNRLDDVYRLKPKYCYIMIGINDISARKNNQYIFENYIKILSGLKSNKIKPIVFSTLYVNNNKKTNIKVQKLNSLLSDYCNKNNIEFIDLNRKLAPEKNLLDIYRTDNIHLNAKGYTVWIKDLKPPD